MKPGYIVAIIFVLLLGAFLFLIRDLFFAPTEVKTIDCAGDMKVCPDGSTFHRRLGDCAFPSCPGFESCVAAGNPVMESYPRQCRWENGTVVVEVIVG